MTQLVLDGLDPVTTSVKEAGRYQMAAVVFTAVGGNQPGKQTHWPLASTAQRCECDCEDCEFLDHCSDDQCEFTDVLPDTALTMLTFLRDQQRKHGVEPDARFAWRRLIVGDWNEV
jgi:hypothetical protein